MEYKSDLLKKDFIDLGFVWKQKNRELQTGDRYPNTEAYELGYFSSVDDYTLITQYPNGYYHISSNIHQSGDPAWMSTVFSGHIQGKAELITLLLQTGIKKK